MLFGKIILGALLNEFGDHSGPAGLMAGPHPAPMIAVKIFIKQNVITPVEVCLKLFYSAEDRTLTDTEVNREMDKIVKALRKNFKAEVR